MKIGAMNSPLENIYKEVERIGKSGFDFVDLTAENIDADIEKIDANKVKRILKKYKLGIVGHSAYYIPTQSPYKSVRKAAYEELLKSLILLKKIGAKNMTIHLMPVQHFFNEKAADFYYDVLSKLNKKARKLGMKLMIEHTEASDEQFQILDTLFKRIPDLKFHLDVGHANLSAKENQTEKFLKKYRKKLEHVHFSDNNGGEDDLHLPLGTGYIDWLRIIKILKKYKYDGTITLEVFSSDKDYLLLSKEKLKLWWKKWH